MRISKTSLIIFIVFLADFFANLGFKGTAVIGGIHVHNFDAISLMLLALSFPYWISLRHKSVPELLLMGLFWLSIASFIAGFRENGVIAGVAYRQDFTVFALLFYMASSKQRVSPRNLIWIILMCSSFGFLEGFLRITGMIPNTVFVLQRGISQSSYIAHRLIGTNASLIIGGLALILFAAVTMGHVKGNRRIWVSIIGIIALAIAIADMNRSVWLAIAGGVLVLSMVSKWRGSFKSKMQFFSVMAVVLGSTALIVWSIESQFLIQAYTAIFASNSTAAWRIIGWQGLIDKVHGLHVLWGMGYGADQTRMVFGHEIDFSSHNLFVHYYFYVGLLGLGLYLALMVGIFNGLRKIKTTTQDQEIKCLAISLMALFVLLFIYHIAYSQWLLDGIVYGYSLRLMRQYGWKFRMGRMLAGQHAPRPLPGYADALPDRPL